MRGEGGGVKCGEGKPHRAQQVIDNRNLSISTNRVARLSDKSFIKSVSHSQKSMLKLQFAKEEAEA